MKTMMENRYLESSGNLINLKKRFILKPAAESIFDFNKKRDMDGLQYARKLLVKCIFSKNMNNVGKVHQIFPNLQEIVAKKRNHFY